MAQETKSLDALGELKSAAPPPADAAPQHVQKLDMLSAAPTPPASARTRSRACGSSPARA